MNPPLNVAMLLIPTHNESNKSGMNPDLFDTQYLFRFAVEFFVDFFEVGVGHVGVDLGRCDVGVAEH